MAGRQVYDGASEGVTLGASTSALVSLYGVAGVVQASAITAPDSTAATSTTLAYGYTTSTQADAIVTAVRALITAVKNVGVTA